MRCKVNRSAALGAALAAVALCSASGALAVEHQDEAARWTWAIALTTGITTQDQFGNSQNSAEVISFTPGTTRPAPLRPPAEGTYIALNPYFGASAELMTPALEWMPGLPRFFANVEILPTFASTGTTALEGSATGFLLPERRENIPRSYSAESIGGTGSRLFATTMSTAVAAGLGAAFPVKVRGRLIRLKPSVGWLRYGVLIEGVLLSAFKDDPDPPILASGDLFGANTRYITMTGRGADFFNAIGPGLEIEMELGRFGSFRPSLFLDGHGYRLVGNQTIEIHDSASFDDVLGQANYSVNWRFEAADWIYRAGLGFRIRWVGAE